LELSKVIAKDSSPAKQPLECDVCIVGSGAAGCVLAYELSRNGKKVVILEKGPHRSVEWIRENEKNEDKLSQLWKNKGIFLSRNFSVNIGQGQCVGGSTMINYGICFKIPDAVFSYWKSTFGITISEEQLEGAYRRVADKIKVRKIDPLHAGNSHVKLKEGCDRLGYSSDWMDKCYVPEQGKQSAYLAYLQKANFDNIELYPNCTADKIQVKGNEVVGITADFSMNQSRSSQKLTVNAKYTVISAGAIASSELLLRNNTSNNNEQVGKHLSIHPSSSVLAEFNEDLQGDEGMAMAYYCDEFSVRKTDKPGFMIESVFVPPSQYSIIAPSFGNRNKEYLRNYNRSAMAGVLVHDEPSGSVTLNWRGDAVVDYELSEADQKKMIDGLKEASRIYLRAGATRIITGHMKKTEIHNIEDLRIIDQRGAGPGSLLMASVHPQGGNRMGEDRTVSVVDSHCKCHQISNLYVCDASVFPTSVGVNPQYTVMAVATLTADHLNKCI
jgi:choline dehydrogenase-like flavoprotein